eukprot:CAMPEP_0113935636 /NCGR_PEP_ID=MMETSP1339-20121228/2754_1 /TAXON_ID=94617 /ORGANISM="Fibrocapsa japonica" /LENGTH=156 /DNA_ID=CAMNT_0000937861 /DNA_START=112 /DNA_END=582 /DNA_ORIENTATION=- /assembly_acc=CAM_ASM_000762
MAASTGVEDIEKKMTKMSVELAGLPQSAVKKGTKDTRSKAFSSVDELNLEKNYHPIVWEIGGKKYNVGCGNDCEDLCLIACCLGTLWAALIGIYALLLKAALEANEHSTLLWTYFFFGLIFVGLIYGSVHTGQIERTRNELRRELAEKARRAAEDA